MESFEFDQARFYFGAADFVMDLTGVLQNATLTATPVLVQTRRADTPGDSAMTADIDSVQHALTAALLRSDEIEPLILARRQGIFFIAQIDAQIGMAFPCVVTAVPQQFPEQGDSSMINLSVTERATTGFVSGELVDGGNNAAGAVKYVVGARSVILSSSGAVAQGGYGVGGTPIVGEGFIP